ncbi:hypothetical protein SETIT_9G124600v2 [Setaria italica]|uniref:F-box domain-containing protein n=1 Tax=Setaria italica TaxID=4555 RepID=A0A368SFT1_SETIT|nr:hypothetical protein SETIT_9G124600v2 [Setaria italica]
MAPPRPALPTDCLFHVFLHLDPISIVRCAAVSRHWRRAVTDNASEIRRHSMGRADRYLLLGLPSREMYPGELSFSRRSSWLPPAGRHWSDFVPPESARTKLYAQLACSDGLLLLCRGLPSEISVVNPQTGFHTSIARPGELAKFTRRYILHSCHGAKHNSFQITHPTDVTTGRARMTRLPKQCPMHDDDVLDRKMLMLATSEGDLLSLLRREEASLEVSVWLYVGDQGCKDWEVLDTRLEWFCPRSRRVILWIPYLGLFEVLRTKHPQKAAGDSYGHVWPYEIDLTLSLCSMKSF